MKSEEEEQISQQNTEPDSVEPDSVELALFKPNLRPVSTPVSELGLRFKRLFLEITAEKGSAQILLATDSPFCKNMSSAINSTVSHNGKIPCTYRRESACVGGAIMDEIQRDVPYVTSATTDIQRGYSYQGNSSYLTQAKLLHLEFRVEERIISLWRALLEPEESLSQIIFDSLLLLGLSQSTLMLWIETAKAHMKKACPDIAGDVQVLIKRSNTDQYVSLSPLYSTGLGRELRERTKVSVWDEHAQNLFLSETEGLNASEKDLLRNAAVSEKTAFWIKFGEFKVGGTKPQNAGDYCNSVGVLTAI